MPRFSDFSRRNLATCDVRLQILFNAVVRHFDIRVLEGFRNEEDQNRAFDEGNSQLRWPQSKHNKQPSLAVDVAPYPIDWEDIDRFKAMGWFVKGIATVYGIPIVWGGDWQNFKDYPHFELKE